MGGFFRLVLLQISLLACLYSVAFGQARQPSAEEIAASGSFEGKLYSNKLLGFTMLAPGGWNFYTDGQNKVLVATNREKNQGGKFQVWESSLERSAANTQVLFQAVPFVVVKTRNAVKTGLLSCGIERLQGASTSEKYIEVNKKLVLRSPNIKITKDTYPMTFAGAGFAGFDVEGEANGAVYRQRYIATVRKNVALFFVITLYDNKYEFMAAESLKTLKFAK